MTDLLLLLVVVAGLGVFATRTSLLRAAVTTITTAWRHNLVPGDWVELGNGKELIVTAVDWRTHTLTTRPVRWYDRVWRLLTKLWRMR